ncbi:hypothetical protein GCM10028804_33290 [Larkinella terrae]
MAGAIVFALKQSETGVAVAEICRKMGISVATYYNWNGAARRLITAVNLLALDKWAYDDKVTLDFHVLANPLITPLLNRLTAVSGMSA